MGKSYKQNDRHFRKNGRHFSKTNKPKSEKRINFDKIKQVIQPMQDDLYEDLRGLS